MKLETFVATLRHDDGKIRLKVVSLNGEKGAKAQIMAAENCPESAIVKIQKTGVKHKR